MEPATSCRICAARLELFIASRGAAHDPSRLVPTCHEPGAHGDLYRCPECGTVQQPSLPEGAELHALYAEMSDEDYLREEPGRREASRRLLDLLDRPGAGGRLLEVGCGHGLLLDEARRRGFEVEGLELSRAAARHARERLGLTVHEVPVEDPALDGERYDAVILADVIEHLDDPAGTIDRCAELLAPGGALLVVTPDPGSLTARLAGRRWWGYLPAHFCLIPRRTLRELIAARGLVIAEDLPYVRTFSAGYWMAGLAERGGPIGAAVRGALERYGERWRWSLSLGDERVVLARRVEVCRPERPLISDRGLATKVHVVLPGYNAERTVAQVAEALPVAAADRALLVDDHSPDGTVRAALEAGLEVLVHTRNRGYGANQKTCYARAALDGADIVVMVHADNQYDPALVAQMVGPIESGDADVVIGSRILEDEAIAGGMPRWKWVGNRFLTAIENRAFGRHFSEYHTGYRAFSMRFLREVPFLRNADDFVFDQEMFAQIVSSGARVVELPIPTRYFLEASSVSFRHSVIYGLKTLALLIRFRLDVRRGRWTLLRRPAAALTPTAQPGELVGRGT